LAALLLFDLSPGVDNDVGATEAAVGYHTAVMVATEAIDRLQPTAASHDRVMILEVMGRDSGQIALAAGIAGGADVILVPMCLARPPRAWAYAALCTVASVAGGALGYAIGALLFDTVGHWLISVYGYAQKIETVRQFY